MDSVTQMKEDARNHERIFKAIARSPADKAKVEELYNVRNLGVFRDMYETEENRIIADILEELFPEGYQPQSQEDELLSIDGIGEETAADLRRRGIESKADLKEASDEDLLEVPGIGQGTLKKIRKDAG